MSPHRVLRPFFGFLAVLALMSLSQPDPAHARDCESFSGVCVDETLTTSGNSRILTIKLNPGVAVVMDHVNVIVPGQSQTEWKFGSVLRLGVQPDGTVTYSAQSCSQGMPLLPGGCNPWRQVTRRFAPVNACQDYTNAAIAAVGASDGLGCGFGGAGRWDHNAQAHLNACLMFVGDWQGYVKNETDLRASDLAACKARIAAANKPIEKPIKSTGKAKAGDGAALTPGGALFCQGGGGMQVTIADTTGIFVAFTPAAQPANVAPPGPGQCAWRDRLFGDKEAHRFAFNPNKHPNAQLLLKAAKGGTFQVTATPVGGFIMVDAINGVQVADSTPLSPGSGGGGTPPVQVQGGGATGGGSADQGPVAFGGTCGGRGATATVVINQPGLDKLNVRSGPGGEVIGTVPEGGTVSVIGPCGATGAAGFAKQQMKPGDGGSWCQISAPVAGCVSAQFLQFGGTDGGKNSPGSAAGFAKPRR